MRIVLNPAITFVTFFCFAACNPQMNGPEERTASEETAPGTCPTEGRTHKGNPPQRDIQELNRLKNRHSQPKQADIDAAITMDALYNAPDEPHYFDEHKAVTVEGYLADAKEEKGESCNCYSQERDDHDIHVFLSPTPYVTGGKKKDWLVVEMTPYSKQLMPGWTTRFMKDNRGRKVRVTGWLMFDFEHVNVSTTSRPDAERQHRHNVWEIHPITSIAFAE